MVISDEQLDKYLEIRNSLVDGEITREEAYNQALRLIQLVELVYRPIPIEDFEEAEMQIWALQADSFMRK